jgi:hypothetical protein
VRLLVLAIALTGCWGYDPPSYDGYLFSCDDAHRCPSPQTCVGGLCRYAGPSRDGVKCGTEVCTDSEQCCFDGLTAFCIANFETCSGGFGSEAALCDGPEDCAQSTACCASGSILVCTPSLCDDRVCIDASDCDGSYHYCCPNSFNTMSPFYRCASDPC